MDKVFAEGEVLNHGKFGLGLVTRVLSDAKLEVVFTEGKKIVQELFYLLMGVWQLTA